MENEFENSTLAWTNETRTPLSSANASEPSMYSETVTPASSSYTMNTSLNEEAATMGKAHDHSRIWCAYAISTGLVLIGTIPFIFIYFTSGKYKSKEKEHINQSEETSLAWNEHQSKCLKFILLCTAFAFAFFSINIGPLVTIAHQF